MKKLNLQLTHSHVGFIDRHVGHSVSSSQFITQTPSRRLRFRLIFLQTRTCCKTERLHRSQSVGAFHLYGGLLSLASVKTRPPAENPHTQIKRIPAPAKTSSGKMEKGIKGDPALPIDPPRKKLSTAMNPDSRLPRLRPASRLLVSQDARRKKIRLRLDKCSVLVLAGVTKDLR